MSAGKADRAPAPALLQILRIEPQQILRHKEAVLANHFAVEVQEACLIKVLVYSPGMSTVHEIETAVRKLSRRELSAFRDWFSSFDAEAWDKQFEQDVAAGRLDNPADEAIRDSREGR